MAGVWLAQGLTQWAGTGLGIKDWLNSLTLRLFVNAWTPTVSDGNGNYTEATFPGYAAQNTTTWNPPGLDGNNNLQYDGPAVSNTSTGGSLDTVYGYYLTDGSGNVVFAEAASVGFPMSVAGLTYEVDLFFYQGQCEPPL